MSFQQPPYWASERGGLRGWPQHVGISVVTPPAGEPLSIGDLRDQVKLTENTDDRELLAWGAAARQDVETRLAVRCVTQAVDLTLAHFPFDRRPFTLPIRPLLTITGIDYVDASGVTQTLDPSLYDYDTPNGDCPDFARLMLKYGQFYWPFPPAMEVLTGVTIHGSFGFGPTGASTPAALKSVMLLLVGNWWTNREAGQIVRGSADKLPYGLDYLIEPYLPVSLP